jgi:hypothetical protein
VKPGFGVIFRQMPFFEYFVKYACERGQLMKRKVILATACTMKYVEYIYLVMSVSDFTDKKAPGPFVICQNIERCKAEVEAEIKTSRWVRLM